MSEWMPRDELSRLVLMRDVWKPGLANVNNRNNFRWDAAWCDAVIADIDEALSGHAAWDAARTPENRLKKDRLIGKAVKSMRDFAAPNIRDNRRMTPEEKLHFGVKPRDGKRTPGGVPQTRPNITGLRALGGAAVEVRFQDEATPYSRAIPAAFNGGLLAFAWGPEKVTDYEGLTRTELATKHIWPLQLPPDSPGKWLSIAIRWQSRRGKLGRWSEIMHIAIS